MNCPVCGRPMYHFAQPAFLSDWPDIEQAECHEDCDYRYVTLSPSEHATMTPEQREGYMRANQEARKRNSPTKTQEDLDLEALFVAAGLNRAEGVK